MTTTTLTPEQQILINELIENSERIVNEIKAHVPGNGFVCEFNYFLTVGKDNGGYHIQYSTTPTEYPEAEARIIRSRITNGHGKAPQVVSAKEFHTRLLADAIKTLNELKGKF